MRKVLLLFFFCLSCKTIPSDYLLLTDTHPAGMFSMFDSVLSLLRSYERGKIKGLKVNFGFDGLYFDTARGPNWWSYYFQPIEVGNLANKELRAVYRDEPQVAPSVEIGDDAISREDAYTLIKKYFILRPAIGNQVDDFVKANFQNYYVIGVHYRGTDKVSEAPRAAYYKVKVAIDAAIKGKESTADYRIFLATDEDKFLTYLQEQYPNRVVFRREATRSKDGTAVHLSGGNGFKLGEDALLDCLLLSRSNFLIRTSSNLSRWSTYFGPKIPVVEVTKRYDS